MGTQAWEGYFESHDSWSAGAENRLVVIFQTDGLARKYWNGGISHRFEELENWSPRANWKNTGWNCRVINSVHWISIFSSVETLSGSTTTTTRGIRMDHERRILKSVSSRVSMIRIMRVDAVPLTRGRRLDVSRAWDDRHVGHLSQREQAHGCFLVLVGTKRMNPSDLSSLRRRGSTV